MTITDIQQILSTTPGTLAQARRVIDFIKGALPSKPGNFIPTDLQAVMGERTVDDLLNEQRRTGRKMLDILVDPAKPSATPSKPSASPTPAKPSATPSAARPAPSATAPARPAPTASDRRLAAAILDEHEAREAAAKVRTRSQLAVMSPAEIGAFFKAGGKLTD